MGFFTLTLIVAPPCLASEGEPQELAELNDAYQRAQERALEPLKVTYLSELKSLLEKLTKQGRLDDALVVKNMLEGAEEGAKVEPEEPLGEVKPPRGVTKLELAAAEDLIGEWIINHKPDDVLAFDEKKQVRYGREKGEWSLSRTFTANLGDTRFTIGNMLEEKDEIMARRIVKGVKEDTPVILTRKKE